jgi:hypothetical protein
VVATLPAGLTYSLLRGHEKGNYQIVGNELRMVADNGVDWTDPLLADIEILAASTELDDMFKVKSRTGRNFYMGDELIVADMTVQPSAPAIITTRRGNQLTPAGVQGVRSGADGSLNLTDASNYTNASALSASLTIDKTDPVLALVVVAQGGASVLNQRIFDIGSSQSLRLSVTSTNLNQVRWRLIGNGAESSGATDTSFPVQAWSATKQVFWIWFDTATDRVKSGRNLTTDIDQAFTAWGNATTGNTLGRTVTILPAADPKIGSFLVRKSAELVQAEVDAAIQRVMTLHGIT